MSASATPQTLTEHLLSPSSPWRLSKSKTEHPFLASAKAGTLPLASLATWLAQDRIYAAHAYPRFIGALIARIPFRAADALSGPAAAAERRNQHTLKVLVGCLENIVREVGFFADMDQKYAMGVAEWGERKETRDYTAEMARVALAAPFEDGIVFLYAMEQIYLEVWTDIKAALDAPGAAAACGEATPALREFADNWSSPAFVAFVQALRALVDALEIAPGTERWARALGVWDRVVELEAAFWP